MAVSFFSPWSLTSLQLGMYPGSQQQVPYYYGPVDNTPARPIVWGNPINVTVPQTGMNPGSMPVYQYATTNPAQNQFNWGSPTVPAAPVRPWGLQQIAKPLTQREIANLTRTNTAKPSAAPVRPVAPSSATIKR